MSALDLHGARTGNSLRASLALAESGLPFRAIPVKLGDGEHRRAPFLAINPLGKVPAMVIDDGHGPWVLTQSAAIMLEVARRSGGRLMSPNPRDAAVSLERFFYFLTDVMGPSHAGFALRQHGMTDAAAHLDELVGVRIRDAEAFLRRTPWMGGTQFSIADIAAFVLVRANAGAVDFDAHPALGEWVERIGARPATRLGLSAFG